MKREPASIATPLSFVEIAVLSSAAKGLREEPTAPQALLDWTEARQALVAREMLTKAGVVSPEGLAALLDTVPVEALTGRRGRLYDQLGAQASTEIAKQHVSP